MHLLTYGSKSSYQNESHAHARSITLSHLHV